MIKKVSLEVFPLTVSIVLLHVTQFHSLCCPRSRLVLVDKSTVLFES